MLTLQNVSSGYGESDIVRDVNLQVVPGKVVCLMGRNGVGKTTCLKTIMGVLKAKRGTISLRGENLTRFPSDVRAAKGIGYVPQGRGIFPNMTVYENLLIGLEGSRGSKSAIPEEALAKFPVLKEMLRRKGGDLSGGQQQQLAIARSLASSPSYLLLDEPTEGIQPSIVEQIREVIRSIKHRADTAILLVEQSIEFAKSVGDTFYIMEKGSIVSGGEMSELNEEMVHRHLAV